jgi:hypothetical protein
MGEFRHPGTSDLSIWSDAISVLSWEAEAVDHHLLTAIHDTISIMPCLLPVRAHVSPTLQMDDDGDIPQSSDSEGKYRICIPACTYLWLPLRLDPICGPGLQPQPWVLHGSVTCVTIHKLILWCTLQFFILNLVIIPTEVLIRHRKMIFCKFHEVKTHGFSFEASLMMITGSQ